MKKSLKKVIISIIIILLLSSVIACSSARAEEVALNNFLGAPITLVFSSSQSIVERQKLVSRLNDTLKNIESKISTEDKNSDIYKFNELETGEIEISYVTYELFGFCEQAYNATNGNFNIASYMLVDLWGFSSRHQKPTYSPAFAYDRQRNEDKSFNLPDEKYISAFKALADFSSIKSKTDGEKHYLIKNCKPQYIGEERYTQKIDLSAIAKGYALDECRKIIDESNLTGTYISFGGSSLHLSDNNGDTFELGIVNPFDKFRNAFAGIAVRDTFVSTSGVYENCYTLSGRTYHHIIDSKTGEPASSDLVSATIIGLDGKLSDAYSTVCIILGRQKAIEFLSTLNCAYVLVDRDKCVYTNSLSLNIYDLEFSIGNDK